MSVWSHEYYRSMLTERCIGYYDSMISGMFNLKNRIVIPYPRADMDDMSKAFDAIMLDHPEIFWINGYDGYECISGPYASELRIHLFFSEQEVCYWSVEAENWRRRVCRQIPTDTDDYMKIWMICDYLARQVDYGFSENRYSQTIIGCMRSGFHRSVCEGISKSFKFLCDGAGIRSIVVFGTLSTRGKTEGHAWNVVECNGKMFHLDVTAMLDYAKWHKKADKRSFLKRTSEMTDYTWDRRLIG